MTFELLFWIYLINAVILINHEIDSAYWKEWNLFKPLDKFGIKGFLIFHFPILILILYGLILVYEKSTSGLVFSIILAASGIFAFFFHFYHLRKGRQEFNNWVSKSILIAALAVSVFQAMLTLVLI